MADVVVIGGGLSGLVAARVLAQAGLESVVLEARDRVGGRTANEPIGDGAVVDMGGQWVADRDAALRRLVDELGIELLAAYDRGRHVIDVGRGVRRYRGSVPRVRPRTLLDVGRARWRIDSRARKVSNAAPWDTPHAAEWDATTFGDWLDENMRTEEGRALLDAAVTTLWGEDPHGVNLLSALAFVSMAGSFDRLRRTRRGMVQDRVAGGSARIAETIAEQLGDRVVLDCPVEAITDHGSRVEVEARGMNVTARRAIVAVPPALTLGIRFDPGLPERRRCALESLPLGSVIKIAVVYERPFWREQGLSGQAVTAEEPITTTMDSSPPGGQPGVLIAFAPGTRARELAALPAPRRREAVLASLTRLYGPQAGHPQRYLEKDWAAEPWTRGCYFGLPAAGAITGLLRGFDQPTGSIHWAGTETAFGSWGGMDGAVVAGDRAGREVAAALSLTASAAATR